MKALTGEQWRLLKAMAGGMRLKNHRDIEGHKVWRLHPAHGEPSPADAEAAQALQAAGLIAGNMKFPSATYGLTAAGRAVVESAPAQPGSNLQGE